ncbi:phosphatidate cytidylyltransferase [Petroclostridium sp. X23]|uniref:phosphatidate cytidylyltransferase n=1 Tax=Petroclostridium sp. X23 TaxID=3045146 RepID=UPI0024AD4D7C|nr:phosphatidate cytidylyltransferase [Petroclostridium sp. X23]WHH58971.1 phosphatidate cytidylyltransferase [Petroclostridium sp. X23]
MLGKRVVSAAIGIIILVVVLTSNKIFINIGVAVISVLALHELFCAAGNMQNTSLVSLAFISSVIMAFSNFMEQKFIMPMIYGYIILLFVIILIKHNTIKLSHIAITCFSTVYISYFFSHIVFTRYLPEGNILIWMIFLGAWTTDTFAFFVGTSMGKRKLWPEISPKKTVEGALGGIIGCGLSFLLFGYLIHYFGNHNVHYGSLFVLGLACSIVSQLGDLSASIIKRQYNIKDFGRIMPGHGGVLDRFDSIVFVAPLVYYFTMNFSIIS